MRELGILLLVCAVLEGCRCSALPEVPNASPYFESASEQLELGRSVYLFADIDGDSERAADFLLSLLRDRPGFLRSEQRIDSVG